MISEFDSLPEAREHALEARTPNGGSSFEALAEFDFRAQPDDTWEGFVIRQIKTMHRPGDPISGVRIYA
jgi:hypothetical protein